MPKVGINHNLNEDTLISLKPQKSYRPGGIEYDFFNNNDYLFNDETVWKYDLSLSGKLPNKSINYSANLFYMDWKDQQLTIPRIPGDLTSSVVTNVKDSYVYGGELEILSQPSEGLILFASIGAALTEFEEFEFDQIGTCLLYTSPSPRDS